MLRKGIVDNLAGIMLVVISISAVATTLNSIQSQTLDDSSQGLMDSLNQFNGEVDIENEEQFRGLVTWNMLASQQCLYTNMIYNRGDIGEAPGDVDIGEEELAMNLADQDDILTDNGANIQNLERGQFTFFGDATAESDPLSAVVDETSFTAQCVGAQPISITQGPGAVVDMISPDLFESGLQKLKGYSLEGRFGSVDYNMQDTVLIEDEKLFAMKIDDFWWDSLNGDGPDFVRGQRASVFIPPETVSGGSSVLTMVYMGERLGVSDSMYSIDNYKRIGFNLGVNFKRSIWAFRVRMKDIPILIDGTRFDLESKEKAFDGGSQDQFKEFVREADYLLCEGSSGRIQSNAGRQPETDSVERGQNPVPRDLVYTVVQSTSGRNNCIDGGSGSEGITTDYFGEGAYAPVGGKVYFSEDQALSSTGYSNYKEPRYAVNEETGRYMSDEEGEIIIGKHEGNQVKMAYRSVLARTTSTPLQMDWIDEASNNIYTREFGLEKSECPENPVKTYEISHMNRISDNPSGSKTVLFPVSRFESGNLEAEVRLDASYDQGEAGTPDIRMTGYSSDGAELSAFLIDETGSDSRGYTLRNGEGGNSLDSQSSNSDGDVTVSYDYDALNSQSIEISDPSLSQGESPQATVDDAPYKLRYIEIEASQGAEFEVEQFEVQAAPEGCNP